MRIPDVPIVHKRVNVLKLCQKWFTWSTDPFYVKVTRFRLDTLNFPTKGICTSPPPSCEMQEFVDHVNGKYLSVTKRHA